MKPVIGITCNYDYRDAVGIASHMGAETQDWDFLASDYVSALLKAGGVPVIIPQCSKPEVLLDLLDRLDGILLSGGCDVDPACYGERVKSYCGTLIPRRDTEEILLVKAAYEKKMPILGICRGLQVMTVAFGGTLYQDLARENDAAEHFTIMYPRNAISHKIALKEDSRLREIFGKDSIGVNSFHHQGVKSIPANGRLAAEAADDVIEALEFTGGHPFTIGVQWHPEMMYDSEEQLKLTRAFVDAARQA